MTSESPQVILLDVLLSEHNGLELFRKIKVIDNRVPIIFITGDTSSQTAIQAMSVGAFNYLSKPLNVEQVRQLTMSAARARKLMDEPVDFTSSEGTSEGKRFIGKSTAMIEVYKAIGRVALYKPFPLRHWLVRLSISLNSESLISFAFLQLHPLQPCTLDIFANVFVIDFRTLNWLWVCGTHKAT